MKQKTLEGGGAAADRRIHKLPAALANQIAAGEVIERPASIVKELLENSLDAGASEIKLAVKNGGRLLISVQDNGHGIHRQDMALALTQHATSKLFTPDDLNNINTLGFRGEALSSIASVSRLKIASRRAGDEHGWMIETENGSADSAPAPVVMAAGAGVDVRELFFNVPARRKFLRADNTEFFYIREIVKRIALSRPGVSFQLTHNDRNVLRYSGKTGQLRARVREIFGGAFLDKAFELEFEQRGVRFWGWLGRPQMARNQTDQQYFYLNNRVIRDRQINHAIRMATEQYLYHGKHPVYALFLEMDAAQFDINVHPAKREVRFRQARDVHDFIFASLKQTCEQCSGVAESDGVGELIPPGELWSHRRDFPLPAATMERQNSHAHTEIHADAHTATAPDQRAITGASGAFFGGRAGAAPALRPSGARGAERRRQSGAIQGLLRVDEHHSIIQTDGKTFLIDAVMAHQRLILSRLQADFAGAGLRRRPLLVPLILNKTEEEADFIESRAASIEKFGLRIERMTPTRQAVREIPSLLEYADVTGLADDLFALLKAGASDAAIIEAMSAHANDAGAPPLDADAMAWLLDEARRLSQAPALTGAVKELDAATLSALLQKA